MELINSAVEATVDRIGLEYHELSGKAKDIASAAVLFGSLLVALTWLLILL
ncbi:MAG: diacylglycerol kinase [Cycloclasticus pugetii]